MKGREAIRAARRREAEAEQRAAATAADLDNERAEHKSAVTTLEAEIRRLKSDHLAEASAIAQKELARLREKEEEQRRKKGLSDELVHHQMVQKDRFIMNACRYLSMTEGVTPSTVFPRVMTWCTDEDWRGFTDPTQMWIKLGVTPNGWVAYFLKKEKFWEGKLQKYLSAFENTSRPEAMTLDRAQEEGHPQIHPKYKPRWYPPVRYEGIELVEGKPDETTA